MKDSKNSLNYHPQISTPIDLGAIQTFSASTYSVIGLNHLLAYTVYVLKSNKQPVTFENIAVAAHKMFPVKFSLINYPQYPDAARVQLVILHLGPKYVGWLNGKKKTGYYLNSRGIQAVNEIIEKLNENKLMGSPVEEVDLSVAQNVENRTAVETRFAYIKASKSFSSYQEGKFADINDVSLIWDAFQLFISVDDSTKAETYGNLLDTAKRIGDNSIIEFLTWISKNRPHLIGKSKGRKR